MKFREYIRDHLFIVVTEMIAVIICNIFMGAFKVQAGLCAAVTAAILLAAAAGLFWDYARKRKYYTDMQENLQALDQKYLIAETLEEPDFYEGRLINEMIRELEKSMYEHVAGARKYAGDFKDYIEMWVHEVKLPIAGLMLRVKNLKDELESEMPDEPMEMAEKESMNASEGVFSEDHDRDELKGSAGISDKTSEKKSDMIEERLAELSEIEVQLKRINDYTEQVLYYARSENAEKDYVIRETRLGSTVSAVLQTNRSMILAGNITLKVHDLDRTVVTDSKWLEFILGQFLSNSIRYTAGEAEPEIEIYSEEEAGNTILHFRDNGAGIPAEDIGRIWDKAFTGNNGRLGAQQDKAYLGSTGMGLYIVKKLCSKLGHKAEAESVQGEYTDFQIVFGKNDIFKI